MQRRQVTLEQLIEPITLLPQVLINVRFNGDKNPLQQDAVKQSVAAVEEQLGDSGRVLLRKSGTEPLLRVMVEGEDKGKVQQFAEQICDVIKLAV
jgi:phosphoglucosamine mutase